MGTALNNHEKEVVARNIVTLTKIIDGGKSEDNRGRWHPFTLEEYIGVRSATSDDRNAYSTEEGRLLKVLTSEGYFSFDNESKHYKVTANFMSIVASFIKPEALE